MDSVLSKQVLMLNCNYEPMSVVPAKKAIILLYLGKAELVERYDHWVRSVTTRMPLPSIVRLVSYVRVPNKRIILTRKNILKRDGRQCQYCGTRTGPFTVDHVIPRDRGGKEERKSQKKSDRSSHQGILLGDRWWGTVFFALV